MRIRVENEYFCGTRSEIEIPGADGWEDVEGWYVKWGVFHCMLANGDSHAIDLGEEVLEGIDVKRPFDTVVSDPETEEELDCA